jgi:PQQ enzyme repeat
MIACCGRLAGAILGISFAFQAACSIEAIAQEASAGSMNSGACSGDSAAFGGPLSIPHWNGWGVDPSQHRFQPSDMARLTESDLSRLNANGANKSYSCCTFRGSVVALDASTGRMLWKAFTIAEEAKPGATNAVGVQLKGPSGAAIWSAPTFDAATQRIYATTGDNYSDPPTETSDAILAFDAGSGELAWSHQITSGRIQHRLQSARERELPQG